MNVTHSLSSLYSELSCPSSLSSNSITPQVVASNSSSILNHIGQEKNQLTLEQKMLLQLNMYSHQYSTHIDQQFFNYMDNSLNETTNQSLRRPITGFKNFTMKSKFNSSASQSCQGKGRMHTLFPFKHVTSSEFSTDESFSSSLLPAFLSPVLKYSRKVFVGGLPPDIDENEIVVQFRRFGQLKVDWPHKSESKSIFPPKGYAFLIFDKDSSVQELMSNCAIDKEKFYICISSSSIKDKPVQLRPWCLNDTDFIYDSLTPIEPRKTIFVGGVPRPLKSSELADIMNKLYGGVCYAGIDIDPELKYPKGAGRVSFNNQESFVAAINSRFIQLQYNEISKRAEIKPYVLDDQICDMCHGENCGGKFAQYFCANVLCLQYYCELCWSSCHNKPGKKFHKPLVKEGADRPRIIPFKWC